MRSAPGIVAGMNAREKARLYHELGQMVRTGTPFPKAIEMLSGLTRGNSRQALVAVGSALNRGKPVAEALIAGQPYISPLEAGMFSASDRAGRLESGLAHASEYYAAIAEAGSRMWMRTAYPIFILHLAFVALSLRRLVAPDGGLEEFLLSVGIKVALFWLGLFLVRAFIRLVLSIAGKNAQVDQLIWAIPFLGKLRSGFALSRFCSAYNLQLDAGVNVIGSLDVAGRTSGSAVILNAAAKALPSVHAGGSVGAALTATRAFPEPVVRAFAVGEQTGQLDTELRRLADEYRVAALKRLETVSDWLPKIVLLVVAIYIGTQIFGFYKDRFKELQDVMNN
jgi:general secretion pathway protein F